MQPDLDPVQPAAVEFDGAAPVAPAFSDAYFSRAGGAAESRAVFVDGNRLSERFAQLRPGELFTIGETGFGTGLNMLQAAALFGERAPRGARLALVSAEKHPLPGDALARSLSAWPELAAPARALQAAYPPPVAGFHRIALGEAVELVLMLGDAAEMWRRQPAPVDAWFLDGFAPDRNPAMWRPALLELLAARSRPGATLATFTVAGAVRRRLEAAGFSVHRLPGHGRKRHRLVGCRPGDWTPARYRTGEALIVGAGLAGATTARALAERGWRVRVADPAGIAAGASGNRAGVVYTTPSGRATPQNRFYQASYLRALQWLERQRAEADGIAALHGVEQLIVDERQRRKLEDAQSGGHWPAALLQRLDDNRVLLRHGGTVRPRDWCRKLLDHPAIEFRAERIETIPPAAGAAPAGVEADAIIVSVGSAAHTLEPLAQLPLKTIRGQVTECGATGPSRRWRRPVCHTGYLTPAVDGVHLIGATFDPGDRDPEPRDTDDAANVDQLRRHLPAEWRALGGDALRIVGRRVGFRCQAIDFLPLAGAAGTGLLVNLAHGSRGITGTPLTAELIADRLAGLPPAVDSAIVDALDPERFARRANRRRR